MSAIPVSESAARLPALRAVAALASGLLFGIGLSLARMVDPRKVLGFLDVLGDWDPSLLFVLGGAVVVAFLGYRLVDRRGAPLLDLRFHVRDGLRVDRRLVLGSVIFGLGWGLAGYCPGPAIASLGYANPEALWLVPAMLAGAGLQRWQAARKASASS
jgi:uncharacterized membrane protein YedE/YeeE